MQLNPLASLNNRTQHYLSSLLYYRRNDRRKTGFSVLSRRPADTQPGRAKGKSGTLVPRWSVRFFFLIRIVSRASFLLLCLIHSILPQPLLQVAPQEDSRSFQCMISSFTCLLEVAHREREMLTLFFCLVVFLFARGLHHQLPLFCISWRRCELLRHRQLHSAPP